MHPLKRNGFTLGTTAILALAFTLWTWWLPASVDQWWQVGVPDPTSRLGQVLAIVAGVTSWPVLLVVTGIVAAIVVPRARKVAREDRAAR